MCKLCNLDNSFMRNETCVVVMHDNPTNHGHMLIVPKRHIKSYFELRSREIEDMHQLAKNIKSYLDNLVSPEGYNVGFNIGDWAGQEYEHTHMHVIPRYAGDVPATELRGGIANFKGIKK